MPEHLTTTKMTPSALRLLRMISAATGELQYQVVDRLLAAEAKARGLPLSATATERKDRP
jgi:hypothetical protein